MSETVNETFPVVNVVKNQKWIDFNDENRAEKIEDNEEQRPNHKSKNSLDEKPTIESSNVHLPPPPKRILKDKYLNDKNDQHLLTNKSTRSSTSYLYSSPSSSSTKINHLNHKEDHLINKQSFDLSNKSLAQEKSNEFALNIPESFIKSSSINLQNVPLRDAPSSNAQLNSPLSSQSSSRFKNGNILVSLLPLNRHCAWITPALFKPELVPEELMVPELKLTVEDYVQALQTLVNDYRFNMYIVFYKKVTLIWLILGFCILFSLLFSNAEGVTLFLGMVIWIFINAFGFLITCWMKIKMVRNLEKCVARVNEQLYKNNIILAVEDKGKISCHKINLIFFYFDATQCIKHLNSLVNRDNEIDSINNTISNLNELNNNSSNMINLNKYGVASTSQPPLQINMLEQDVDISDIIITGSSPTRLTMKEKYGDKLFLRYSQRWGKNYVRQTIGFSTPLHYDSSIQTTSIEPRHCKKARCICQYIEEHLRFKSSYHRCGFRDLFG